MEERRRNWNDFLHEDAESISRKEELLNRLKEVREKIRNCGLDFASYDAYKLEEISLIAKIAAA